MELIDTHAHLTFPELQDDIEQVLSRSRAAGVRTWITVGTDTAHNRSVVDLADKHDSVYAAVGIHPHHAKDVCDDDLDILRELAQHPKVVAIGETGLDFHYNFSKQERQREIFRAQLELAVQLNLPVVIHSRNAFDDTIAILDEFADRLKRVVFHCYGGTDQHTRAVLDRGWYISFTGIVTFKNAELTHLAARTVPLDRMMIETDCPYISPAPMRNQRPCEPALLVHTAAAIAKLKGIETEQLAREVTATSIDFFDLPA